MEYEIREARTADKPAIAEFTTTTFDWGDYVADVFDTWLADPNGHALVACDENDIPIAISRGVMLSPTELWLQGARVREDRRRLGIAGALGDALLKWGRAKGAIVARLATEDWNTAPQRRAKQVGMRMIGNWIAATGEIRPEGPATAGNGGRRVPAQERLCPAASAEAVPAWVSWRSGPLVGPSRGLFAIGWQWRRLEPADLEAAARHEALWMSPAGWVMAESRAEVLEVEWIDVGPDEATELLRAVIGLAREQGADRVQLKLPAVDWLLANLEQTGFAIRHVHLYELGL